LLASAQYSMGVAHYQDALQNLLQCCQEDPGNILYKKYLGALYEKMNDSGKALSIYNELVKENPDDADIINRVGVLYYRRGTKEDAEKAISYYNKAIELSPSESIFYENLALAYEITGDNEKVVEAYEKSIEKSPHNDDAHNSLGVLYYRTHQFEKAIKSYLKAIELKPQSGLYYQNLGLAYADNGQVELAEDAFLKSLKIEPNNDRYLNLAGIFYHTKRYDYKTALELYSQAIKINAKEPNYFLNLGDAYTLLNDNKQATSAYAKAEELQKVI